MANTPFQALEPKVSGSLRFDPSIFFTPYSPTMTTEPIRRDDSKGHAKTSAAHTSQHLIYTTFLRQYLAHVLQKFYLPLGSESVFLRGK